MILNVHQLTQPVSGPSFSFTWSRLCLLSLAHTSILVCTFSTLLHSLCNILLYRNGSNHSKQSYVPEVDRKMFGAMQRLIASMLTRPLTIFCLS